MAHVRLLLISILFCSTASAQWLEIATGVFTNSGFGALRHKDGVLWVGSSGISKSTNGGKTWRSTSSYGQIYDLQFFDDSIGVISGSQILLTTDQGNTWRTILSGGGGPIVGLFFLGSADTILAGSEGTGLVWRTTNRGQSWTSQSIGYWS